MKRSRSRSRKMTPLHNPVGTLTWDSSKGPVKVFVDSTTGVKRYVALKEWKAAIAARSAAATK